MIAREKIDLPFERIPLLPTACRLEFDTIINGLAYSIFQQEIPAVQQGCYTVSDAIKTCLWQVHGVHHPIAAIDPSHVKAATSIVCFFGIDTFHADVVFSLD